MIYKNVKSFSMNHAKTSKIRMWHRMKKDQVPTILVIPQTLPDGNNKVILEKNQAPC